MAAAKTFDQAELRDWGNTVGEETRKSFYYLLESGFFQRYLSGASVLDVGYKGYISEVTPILPHVIGVDMDYPGYNGKTLPFEDGSQDAIFSSHVLEHISDYRGALRDWFRVLREGGFLVTIVPHQFLYERKAQPPSLWNADHKRFYTTASLMRELEEALPPSSFRVRYLEENDRDFDYAIPPSSHACGSYEIICVIEKIVRPAWAQRLFDSEPRQEVRAFRRQSEASQIAEPLKMIMSAPVEVHRILVLKLDHRGDFSIGTEAFEALRRNFPHAEIVLACGPWNAADAHDLGLFDKVIPFQLFAENASQAAAPFRTESEAQLAFAAELGDQTFDLAIDLRWDHDSRFLLEKISAGCRAGFGTREAFEYLDIPLTLRQETLEGRSDQYLLSADRFVSPNLEHRGYAMLWPEERISEQVYIIYGPYENFSAGQYWLDLMIEPLAEPFSLGFDIVSRGGLTVLGLGEVDVTHVGRVRLPLVLTQQEEGMEIRLKAGLSPVPPFRFLGCIVRREGSRQGVHQSEAMHTLVEVTSARLRNMYAEAFGDDFL